MEWIFSQWTTHASHTCGIRGCIHIHRLNFNFNILIFFTNLGLRVLSEGEDHYSSSTILKQKGDNVHSSEVFTVQQ